MKVLLTGFNPFGNLTTNPSEIIVKETAERFKSSKRFDIEAVILQTEFELAGNQIAKLIRDIRPDSVLLLGVAEGDKEIRLERVALNLKDTVTPDNLGQLFSGKMIVQNGPIAYLSTLPINLISDAIKNKNIPVRISNHAGTFVCNHVFYTARHEIEQLGLNAKCGFIHIPLMKEQTNFSHCLPKNTILTAVTECLEVLITEISNSRIV